jgi:hypothetical protein
MFLSFVMNGLVLLFFILYSLSIGDPGFRSLYLHILNSVQVNLQFLHVRKGCIIFFNQSTENWFQKSKISKKICAIYVLIRITPDVSISIVSVCDATFHIIPKNVSAFFCWCVGNPAIFSSRTRYE